MRPERTKAILTFLGQRPYVSFTYHEIAQATGVKDDTVSSLMACLLRRRLVHVVSFERHPKRRVLMRRYSIGPGPDMPTIERPRPGVTIHRMVG